MRPQAGDDDACSGSKPRGYGEELEYLRRKCVSARRSKSKRCDARGMGGSEKVLEGSESAACTSSSKGVRRSSVSDVQASVRGR